MKGKICVFTGSRAEYGLLYPLMRQIKMIKQFRLQVLVSGMHLSSQYGSTYHQIEKDGFRIEEKVEMLLSSDTDVAVTKSVGLGIIGFADALAKLKPELAVILGDRFEAFAFATACYLNGVPVAHLHGGELTEAASDDGLRHAITKLAYYHFTSAEQYRQRVIQLGECPERVFNVGAIGIDNIREMKLMSRQQITSYLGFNSNDHYLLVTFHPVTLSQEEGTLQFRSLITALKKIKDLKVVFTMPNADANNRLISGLVTDFSKSNPDRVVTFTSMGQLRYLSAMKYCSAVVGNSSSGIIEAPALGIPTVNIGERQAGRIFVNSIIQSGYHTEEIKRSILKAINPDFSKKCKKQEIPYGDGTAAKKIIRILTGLKLPGSLKKSFYDL
ncbi:MAG: UDP-N-acetylglucosamine 2-epimerase (hydrolyzing) [Chitinophagaceae bacterium]|jgi:UDP-hydrolysing UDP-N-acetyl-D-glucosamine 2-epimerase|nr:UDP-N-acetylglucosamine 2-epimerase (hydrolyzing) [Chitinophagaceae bacterium]OQY95703.1 MAG: UDP-N-acetylglucosamine 2-epimerase (hydrolyzing) [Sphingobacteriales bacterium UTBCD1]